MLSDYVSLSSGEIVFPLKHWFSKAEKDPGKICSVLKTTLSYYKKKNHLMLDLSTAKNLSLWILKI
jgi:hypothetical protein